MLMLMLLRHACCFALRRVTARLRHKRLLDASLYYMPRPPCRYHAIRRFDCLIASRDDARAARAHARSTLRYSIASRCRDAVFFIIFAPLRYALLLRLPLMPLIIA